MDASPTALFDSYEQDFKQLVQSIDAKLSEGKDAGGEDRKAALRRVEMEMEEADELVSQLDIEISSIPQNVRQHYHTRLRDAKSSLSRCKTSLKDARSSLARSDLLSSSKPYSSDDPYGSSSDRTRLLSGTQLLENGTKRLEESQRMALETESHGAEILTNLRGQREQIENSRDTLLRADIAIDRASNTLKQMVRRMYQQRAITYSIIAVLIILIVVIVWEKLSG
ncbi:vesicle transport v-snare protein vti1 [Coprinellus micaceus]|uniref:Vesicle transport v-snare protein vti1 n=1 Tax=Coprinellus micaceus TaxID=71717 RepID=A0A4Y7T841_COPMI|nr:vesicle transport v-snare protein vti1 [Coprinellus micaceus]